MKTRRLKTPSPLPGQSLRTHSLNAAGAAHLGELDVAVAAHGLVRSPRRAPVGRDAARPPAVDGVPCGPPQRAASGKGAATASTGGAATSVWEGAEAATSQTGEHVPCTHTHGEGRMRRTPFARHPALPCAAPPRPPFMPRPLHPMPCCPSAGLGPRPKSALEPGLRGLNRAPLRCGAGNGRPEQRGQSRCTLSKTDAVMTHKEAVMTQRISDDSYGISADSYGISDDL